MKISCLLFLLIVSCSVSLHAMNGTKKKQATALTITVEVPDGYVTLTQEQALLSKIIREKLKKKSDLKEIKLGSTSVLEWKSVTPFLKDVLKISALTGKERKVALTSFREHCVGKGYDEVTVLLKAAESCKISELVQILKDCRARSEQENLLTDSEPAPEPEIAATEALKEATESQDKTESKEIVREICTICDKNPVQSKCGRCSLQGYCSAICQKSDWKKHKHDCLQLCPVCKKEKPTMRCKGCKLPYCSDACATAKEHTDICALRLTVFENYYLARAFCYEDLFTLAITVGDHAVFDALLGAGFITIKDGTCSCPSAILEACLQNRIRMVRALADRGASLTIKNVETYTTMHYASVHEDGELVRFLLSKGVPCNIPDESQESLPIHEACSRGNTEVADLLLQANPELKEARTKEGYTPFLCACEKGRFDLARRLIDTHGVDIQAVTILGRSALHFAASNGALEFIQYLLEKGFDKDSKTKCNETPLFMACDSGQEATVRFLLGLKVDTTIVATNNLDAFFMACYKGHLHLVRLLHEEYGFNVKAVNAWNKSTPLHWAAFGNHVALATYLLEKGASLRAHDDNGDSPVAVARKGNRNEVLKLFTKK